ncbi:hypothetical protein FHS56_000939 [Thermonema lapsum]|uniref:Uncharacterized protein n=1 Tax=Thermonema lapsum TaxID=28195 RepID=A0A846MPG8_9BACT|nr:hypothetical protein [Thermonema lapsum]NIK73453.1 hypothetical protein [Thermonema lapsum]
MARKLTTKEIKRRRRAVNRIKEIKRLNFVPPMKAVDVEAVKAEFAAKKA